MMTASLFAMTMVALADGKIMPMEREILVEVLALSGMDAQDVRRVMQGVVDTLVADRGGWPHMLEEWARELPANFKREVLHNCAWLATIDGPENPEGWEMIGSVAGWLGLGPRDLELWRQEHEEWKAATRSGRPSGDGGGASGGSDGRYTPG